MINSQDKQEIRQLISKVLKEAQYKVSSQPYHIHNGVDAPNIPQSSVLSLPARLMLPLGTLITDTYGSTITFNMLTSGNHTVTLTGNPTLAVSNVSAGQIFSINLTQDATGSRTVTWFSGISWAGGSAPTLTTTASKADRFIFYAMKTTAYQGFIVGQNI